MQSTAPREAEISPAPKTGFFTHLSPRDRLLVRAEASRKKLQRHQLLFRQGSRHSGIFIIEHGSIRTFFHSRDGREITLGFWTEDQLVGGPEVFGGGTHMWSGEAVCPTEVLYLRGTQLHRLCEEIPQLSFALIDVLVEKGRRFSEVVQMLGTESMIQRLAHTLRVLATDRARASNGEMRLPQRYTHEQLASMIGASRQWVSISLKRLEREGLIRLDGRTIVVLP